MSWYYGARAICKRMDWSPSTLYRQININGFPVIRRRRKGTGWRETIVTCDEAITPWFYALAKLHRQALARKRAKRRHSDGQKKGAT